MQACLLMPNKGARFHFGEASGDMPNAPQTTSHFLHSDTLFSAIVNAWAVKNPETVDEFIAVCKRGEFNISSGFYCVQTYGKTVFFLPKPVSLNLLSFEDPLILERIERIKMISAGIWENGLLPAEWFDAEKCTLLQNETMVALKKEINHNIILYEVITTPKANIRTADKEKSLYFQTDLYLFGDEGHTVNWYFLIGKTLDGHLGNHLYEALQTMTHLGIGGRRSSGCGGLKGFDFEEFSLKLSDTQYQAAISTVIPNVNELSDNCLYLTMKRGGRREGANEKPLPMVQVLQEGAVFDKDIKGKIVTLSDNPPVVRYGINFSLPLHNNYIKGLL